MQKYAHFPSIPAFSINLLPKGIINGIANKYQQEKWQYDGYKEQHKGELGARAHLARRGHGLDVLFVYVLVCMVGRSIFQRCYMPQLLGWV
jgi:hypothetical protein